MESEATVTRGTPELINTVQSECINIPRLCLHYELPHSMEKSLILSSAVLWPEVSLYAERFFEILILYLHSHR